MNKTASLLDEDPYNNCNHRFGSRMNKTSIMKNLTLLFVFFLSLSLLTSPVSADPLPFSGDGDGTESNPYQITNWTQLNEIRNELGANYTLETNLDENTDGYSDFNSDEGFGPIGNESNRFTGSFDGKGYEISELFISRPEGNYVGLFGYIENATIKDVGLINVNITGYSFVGGLVGVNEGGSILNSHSSGCVNVEGQYVDAAIGGLVGLNIAGDIIDSFSTGNVNVNATEVYTFVGGLVGLNIAGDIIDSFSTGNVNINATEVYTFVGGLVGLNLGGELGGKSFSVGAETMPSYLTGNVGFELLNNVGLLDINAVNLLNGEIYGGIITNSRSFGNVTITGAEDVNLSSSSLGGLIGLNLGGTIQDSCSTGDVTIENTNVNIEGATVGGLVGFNAGDITNSCSTGNVVVDGEYVDIEIATFGGLIGFNIGDVTNSNSTGDVSVSGAEVGIWFASFGGLVGHNEVYAIRHSSSTGDVTVEGEYDAALKGGVTIAGGGYAFAAFGGLAGVNGLFSGEGTIEESYSLGNVIGIDHVGGLVGSNRGIITNSYSAGNIIGYEEVGGLVGTNYGDILDSYSTGNVEGYWCVGGLVGQNEARGWGGIASTMGVICDENDSTGIAVIDDPDEGGSIINSYSTGTVTGEERVGGLVGWNTCYGQIISSSSTGHVTGDHVAGGLVGTNAGEITDSSSTGKVVGHFAVGGFVGVNKGNVTNSFSTGEVSGFESVGGFVGRNSCIGQITDSYSTGNVDEELNVFTTIKSDKGIGGLVGVNAGAIANSYSIGQVNAAGQGIGGLIGIDGVILKESSSYILRSYWNTETSRQGTSVGGEGRTTAEMTSPHASNTYVGWDFNEIWFIHPQINNGYPQLRHFIGAYPIDRSGSRTSIGASLPPENVTSVFSSIKYVTPGKIEYDFFNTSSPVIGISFDARDHEGRVVAKIEVLDGMPGNVSSPLGNIYRMLSITVGSEGKISDDNADNILLNFRVSWDWIRENNIDPDTIRIVRFHDGKWEDLPTTLVYDDGEMIY